MPNAVFPVKRSWWRPFLWGITTAVGVAGCTGVLKLPGSAPAPPPKPLQLEVQRNTMRFADLFRDKVTNSVSQFQVRNGDHLVRLEAQTWKLNEVTAAVQIASGPNAVVNAVDMVVLVTLSREVLEDSWQPRFGEELRGVLEAYRDLDREAWELLKGTITPQQEEELHKLLAQWRQMNPTETSVAFVRLADVVDAGSQDDRKTTYGFSSGSLFQLVGLDPFSNLDPAVREVEQSRLAAERAIFYLQRMPALLDLQVKLVTDQLLVEPEIRQLMESTTRMGAAAQSLAGTAARMPDLIQSERAAAIQQVMDSLQAQESRTRALLEAARQTLEAGTMTADSTRKAIGSLNDFVTQVNRPGSGPPSRPFDINEYAHAADRIATTARDVEQLLRTIDQRTPQVAGALGVMSDTGRDLVDYAFRRILILMGILFLGILLTALLYRWSWALLSRAST